MELKMKLVNGNYIKRIDWKEGVANITETEEKENALVMEEKKLNVLLGKINKTRKQVIEESYPGIKFIQVGKGRKKPEISQKENEVVRALLNYTYENEEINRLIREYRKTKKERIKNKKFKEIFSKAIEERRTIKCGEVVLLAPDVFKEMMDAVEQNETELKKLKKTEKEEK